MNRKFIVAILLVAAMSAYIVYVQAQKPGATKDNAQKVVTIISGDKAKTQTYCEIQKLTQQMEQAEEKNESKTANELSKRIDRHPALAGGSPFRAELEHECNEDYHSPQSGHGLSDRDGSHVRVDSSVDLVRAVCGRADPFGSRNDSAVRQRMN
jgi:hypothetical protein